MVSPATAYTTNAEEVSTPGKQSRTLSQRYFLLALLISTLLPMGFFILVAPSSPSVGGLAGVKAIFLFLGTAHVPATIFFYTDRAFSGVIKQNKLRYIYTPIALTVATGLAFVFLNNSIQSFVLLLYWAWQAFHYGRQNIGVYAFASIAQTGKSPQRLEKLAIDLGTILGVLGTFKIMGMAVAPDFLQGSFELLYQFGYFAFAAVIVFSVIVYIKAIRTTTVFKTAFYFTSVLFFLPVFMSTDINVAFLSYAIAHGLQYIVFMSVISANTSEEGNHRAVRYRNVLTLVMLMLVLGFLFYRAGDIKEFEVIKSNPIYLGLANFFFGAVLGITMSHFAVDAGAWKLSRVLQRSYITKRFSFIFGR